MGTWVTDPTTGAQRWQGDQYSIIPAHMELTPSGDIVHVPESRQLVDTQGAYPGGGTKYDHGAGAVIGTYADQQTGGFYQKLSDGYWYYHTPVGVIATGDGGQVPDNGQWDLTRRWDDTAFRSIAPSLEYQGRVNDPTDHDGGMDLGMLVGFGAIAFGAPLLMGETAGAATSTLATDIMTNAAIGAGTSAMRGGDPLTGALTGAIGGAISGSGIMSDVAGALIPEGASSIVSNAITKGVNAATTGAVGAALNGGSFSDILEAGVTSGLTSTAGNLVSGELRADGSNNTVAGAAAGAASGLTNAVLTGGDIGTGVITGAASGLAGGAAADAGVGPAVAGAVGSIAGGIVGSELTPDPVVTTPPTPTTTSNTPTTPTTSSGGLSWGDINPEFIYAPRADIEWGTRLSGG